jgi:hypothetical protein
MAKVRYFAEDGTEFPTLEAAEAHDQRHQFADLCGLTERDIDDMLAGKHPNLAELAEQLGNVLAKARRERGEFKRAPKKAEAAPSTQEPAPEPQTREERIDAIMAETEAAEAEGTLHAPEPAAEAATVDDFPL